MVFKLLLKKKRKTMKITVLRTFVYTVKVKDLRVQIYNYLDELWIKSPAGKCFWL